MNQHIERLQKAAAGAWAGVLGAMPDLLMVGGTAAIAYGAWRIYAPAGFIVGGLLMIAGGVLAARGAK